MENMVDQKPFWKNKHVFITGHTGFKGSWLSLMLLKLGAKVTGYSLPLDETNTFFKKLNIESDIKNHFDDIVNSSILEKAIKQANPDIIIHMAAQALVNESYLHPVKTYHTNVIGTLNVLEAAKNSKKAHSIVSVTSDKCYENKEWVWSYRENDNLGGKDPYSSSKACADILTTSYYKSFFETKGINVFSVRAGNVIGGGDFTPGRLIPDLMQSAFQNKKINIRSPLAIRPWQHVIEPLSGYMTLVEKSVRENLSGPWNFGPSNTSYKSVNDIINSVQSILNKKLNITINKHPEFSEANTLKIDVSKAVHQLDWKPKLDYENTIEKTLIWYDNFFKGENVRNITLNQIDEYFKI